MEQVHLRVNARQDMGEVPVPRDPLGPLHRPRLRQRIRGAFGVFLGVFWRFFGVLGCFLGFWGFSLVFFENIMKG